MCYYFLLCRYSTSDIDMLVVISGDTLINKVQKDQCTKKIISVNSVNTNIVRNEVG